MTKVLYAAAKLPVMSLLFLLGCATQPDCVPEQLPVDKSEFEIPAGDARSTRITLWQPQRPGMYPLVVFSHGAFSAPERYDAVLAGLSGMGLIVAAPLHIDSELLDGQPEPAEVWTTRKQDVDAVLAVPGVLEARLARGVTFASSRIAAGHSYGAFGAQVAAGARAIGDQPSSVGADLIAVIAFSPPGPLPGFISEDSWASLSRPQLLLTGTQDILPGFIDDWRAHAGAWEGAVPGDQWLWVGEGVDHYFGKVFGRLGRDVPAQDQQFDAAMHTTGQFLQTYVPGGLAVCASSELKAGQSQWATIEHR